MSWQQIEGHDSIAAAFAQGALRRRLEGSYLFTGPEGIGKRTFALALAKTLLCKRLTLPSESAGVEGEVGTGWFSPCHACESCRLFESGPEEDSSSVAPSKPKKKTVRPAIKSDRFTIPSHPDFHFVNKPADRSFIPLELLIGAKEERMTAGLCFDLSRTPYFGGRRIAVIDDADFLNPEGANALLKTLEEPPPESVLILISTGTVRQLPTIRSRCRAIRFSPPPARALAHLLVRLGIAETTESGERLARGANGSVSRAAGGHHPDFDSFRAIFMRQLERHLPESVKLAKQLGEFVDSAGKEAPLRRERLRVVLGWGVDFYRRRLENGGDPVAGASADRTCEALEQIDRNANLPFVYESWLTDIAALGG